MSEGKLNHSISFKNTPELIDVDEEEFALNHSVIYSNSYHRKMSFLYQKDKSLSISSTKSKNQFNLNLFNDRNSFFNDDNDNVKEQEQDNVFSPFIKKSSMETNDTSFGFGVSNEELSALDTALLVKAAQKQEEELEEDKETDVLIAMHSFDECVLDLSKIDDDESLEIKKLDTDENKKLLFDFVNLSKEQSSCRFLQGKIDKEPKLADYFFPTILNNINEIIINKFGNYLIQKILSVVSDTQINQIITAITPNFLEISVNSHGTRVIQKMIKSIKAQYPMLALLELIRQYFTVMFNNVNASHIIMELLSLNQMYITMAIYDMINIGLINISTNKHGCCVIQKILENDSIYTKSIIDNIIQNSLFLSTHQYGNYTIQHILQMKNIEYTNKLKMILLPQFTTLSQQMYSSTVIEKCFELCDEETRLLFYNMIYNPDTMKILICNKYGNYVIQKAIDTARNENTKIYLLQMIFPIINEIRKDNFGRQLYSKLYNKYHQFQEIVTNMNSK